jgi:hypothetical protein
MTTISDFRSTLEHLESSSDLHNFLVSFQLVEPFILHESDGSKRSVMLDQLIQDYAHSTYHVALSFLESHYVFS